MKKFVCVLAVLAALLMEIAAQDVAVFPQLGHTDWVSSVAFSPDGRQALSGSGDGTTRLWDVSAGKEITQFVSFDDNEWIVITPEGYYAEVISY